MLEAMQPMGVHLLQGWMVADRVAERLFESRIYMGSKEDMLMDGKNEGVVGEGRNGPYGNLIELGL
jgi:hypothetical protein